MNRKVLIVLGGVLLVLIVFVWQVVANLDSIVAGAIEETGSDVLNTKVSVSDVSISLKEGKAVIGGLTVANPVGYSSANVFELEGIEVDLNIQSLNEDVLVIESIRVQNPKITFEGNDSGGSNVKSLLDNMDSSSSQRSDSGSSDSSGDKGKSLKMIIERFEFVGGNVKATSTLKPGETLELKLPAVKMSGIGRSQGGVPSDVAIKKITDELLNAVIQAAVKAGVNKALEEKKKDFMKKLGDKLRGDG